MYRFVFFDLDGTVLDTLDDLANAGNYALSEQGFPTFPAERYKYFAGNGIPKMIERILPENSGEELKESTHRLFSEYYSKHCEDNTRPYDGIPELLSKLDENGIKSVVITNKDNEYAGELIKKYFGSLICRVYGSVEGFPKKPDPYWTEKALSDLGADKSEVLYVGDSGVDMQTAKNAGLKSCGVLWGFRKEEELTENGAAYICEKPSFILDIVLKSSV